jgi:hypothetical protein
MHLTIGRQLSGQQDRCLPLIWIKRPGMCFGFPATERSIFGGCRMFGDLPDKTNAVRQDAPAPKQQEQPAERRWLQDALEDDEVCETLKSLRAREKAKGVAKAERG